MQGKHFCVSFHITGTLSEDGSGEFTLPCAASLVEVSFANSAAADATIDVGTSDDPNGIISLGAVGDSGTPAVFTPAEFNGALCDQASPYHMANDTVFSWDMVYGDVLGTAGADVTVVFTFTEG